MSGNKAMRRALETSDAVRIGANLPLITDSTELITPDIANEYLKHNHHNRPINWRKAEEYAKIMRAGKWELHAQGIILDEKGDILTGQTRLWAVVMADVSVYMRVSRGNPRRIATLIDRGRPQSSRDLATRNTERKHSPLENSIARAMCALEGTLRPSVDELAMMIIANAKKAEVVIAETKGKKKSKAMLMVLAAICAIARNDSEVRQMTIHLEELGDKLEHALIPQSAEKCWGKGAAFSLAMDHARTLVTPILAGLCKKLN